MNGRGLVFLLLAAALARGDDLPADLVGTCGAPSVAWQLNGLPPAVTTLGYETDDGLTLLVAGHRAAAEPARLGDLAMVSPEGWARRRIVAGPGLVGLPAMARRVLAAATGDSQVFLWTLTRQGEESTPRKLSAAAPPVVGPVIIGSTLLYAAGSRVYNVSNLFEPRWDADAGGAIGVPLASDGQGVFAATEAGLVALDVGDGHRRWAQPTPAAARTGLVVTSGAVVAGFADGALRAFDTETGAPLWEQKLGVTTFAPDLALAGPWLLAATGDGRLVAFDPLSGEPTWQARRPGPLSSPTAGFGHVFVIGEAGRLFAVPFDVKAKGWTYIGFTPDGQPLPLAGAPCLFGPRLYVGTAADRLVALDLKDADGDINWAVPGGTAQRNGRVVPPEELPAS
jgi:hypothetical protein